MKYKIIRANRSTSEQAVGTIVYALGFSDYGLSSEDTEDTGIEHISVTLKENGDYPSFTIPLDDLQAV